MGSISEALEILASKAQSSGTGFKTAVLILRSFIIAALSDLTLRSEDQFCFELVQRQFET